MEQLKITDAAPVEVPAGMALVPSTGEMVRLYVTEPITPVVVEFTSEDDAYDASAEDGIPMGAVVTVPATGFVGFDYSGRILAVSPGVSEFRRLDWPDAEEEITCEGYAASLVLARSLARG